MLSNQSVLEIINEAKTALIDLDKIRSSKKTRGIAGISDLYTLSVVQKRRIEVHAEDGVFPYELFANRAPNQTDEEKQYIESNYKTITLPVWQAFQSLLNRIWVDQNWKIDYNEQDEIQKYFETEYPVYGNVYDFFKSVVTSQKEIDNNGLIVVKPFYIPTEEVDGVTVVNDREYIKTHAFYYGSETILAFEESKYALVLCHSKSKVEYKGRESYDGVVMYLYDDNNIYKINQVGRKLDWDFEIEIFYTHGLGYMPAWKLNGRAKQVGKDVFYQSVFISAVANLDQALLDNSYLTAKKAQVAFPHKWEYVSDCEYIDANGGQCLGGKISYDSVTYQCPSCKGTSNKASVMGVTQIEMPTQFDASKSAIAPPFLGFVEPSTENLKFLRDEINNYLHNGAMMLNLDISNKVVKGSETATGDAIDREETFTMLKGISDQIFALFYKSMKAMTQMQFGLDTTLPSITPPRVFELRKDTDISSEIISLKTAGMPDVIIVQAIKEYMNIRFSLNIDSQKILNLSTYSDRLLTLSPDDILKKKVSNTVAGWEDILHTSMYSIISVAISENKSFLDLSIEQQNEIIIKKAKDIYLEINPPAINIDNVLGG